MLHLYPYAPLQQCTYGGCALGKIEKVPRDDQGKKGREKTDRSKFGKAGLNKWSTSKSQKGMEPGVRKAKRYLLAYHTRYKCSMETTRISVKVKLGIKAMKLVKSLIGWEVTVTGQGPECHLTFVRGRLHIAE